MQKLINTLVRRAVAVTLYCSSLVAAAPVMAQPLSSQDPAEILKILNSTFQACAPSDKYQLLGAVVYQAVVVQTGNTFCYPQIRALGQLKTLAKQDVMQLSAGPVTTFAATYEKGTATWQIGISTFTQKVEWLTFNPGSAPGPGPTPPAPSPTDKNVGCVIYPEMCKSSQ